MCVRPAYECYNCDCNCHLCRPKNYVRRYHYICFHCKNAYKQQRQYYCTFDCFGYQSPMYKTKNSNKYEPIKHVIACNSVGEINKYSSQLKCSLCKNFLFIGGFNLQGPSLKKNSEWKLLETILTNLEQYFYLYFPYDFIHKNNMSQEFNSFRESYMSECNTSTKIRGIPFPKKNGEIPNYVREVIRGYYS